MVWQFCFVGPLMACLQLLFVLEKSEAQSKPLHRTRLHLARLLTLGSWALRAPADTALDIAIIVAQTVQNLSMLLAMFAVFTIFFATRKVLPGFRPLRKVLVVYFVFLINTLQSEQPAQGAGSGLARAGRSPAVGFLCAQICSSPSS